MRRKTLEVVIGDTVLSSEEPVVVQSMLNRSTMDTEACVEQAIKIIEAGGRLVRITAQGVKEAENLKNIHSRLRAKGYTTPLSADIHFNPEAAMIAARYVEKVRINPGNFADIRATFKELQYTDEEYVVELNRLKEKFVAFLEECRKYGTVVRIGTNHGSLSDRIMSRYGNTPGGMVEATMEYLRVCQEIDFKSVVISLKSSDCKVMVDAVRLLVKRMEEEGMGYPLHLGVTEAGEGEDGRIRSAVGIGTLLNEGIGDTIRVSLTEDPEREIPVAKTLIKQTTPSFFLEEEEECVVIGKPVIVADVSSLALWDEKLSDILGFEKEGVDIVSGARLSSNNRTPEYVFTEALGPELTKLPSDVVVIVPAENLDMAHVYNRNTYPLFTVPEFMAENDEINTGPVFVEIRTIEEINGKFAEKFNSREEGVVILAPEDINYHIYKEMIKALRISGVRTKIFVKAFCRDGEEAKMKLAAHLGGFFMDSLVCGIWLASEKQIPVALELSRGILQSAGARRYKTEFISCPGCGRTLFDLQGAVEKVKAAFGHLDSLKIAVMGCVVNGPGEMGDADYGYVGAGSGKVNLYKGKSLVLVGVEEGKAIEELKRIIEKDLSC